MNLSRCIFALYFPVLDLKCQGYFLSNTNDVFISLNSQQLVLRHSDSHHCVYVSPRFERCVCHVFVSHAPPLPIIVCDL